MWVTPLRARQSRRLLLALLGVSSILPLPGAQPERAVDPRDEIAALRAEIAWHDDAYHRAAAPVISDAEYDRLKVRLAALEQKFPTAARAAPPLDAIPDDRSGLFRTQPHREPMLSLEKAHQPADVRGFHDRLVRLLGRDDLEYVVEPKYDGLAVSLVYERGQLVRAVTRGNGRAGDDVTAHVRAIPGLPPVLAGNRLPTLVEVRGEVYVPFDTFARVNRAREAAGEAPFANPRALAAGTLRQLDAQEVVRRGLQLVCFGVGACEPREALPATQQALTGLFRAWGLPAVDDVWPARGAAELVRAIAACGRARSLLAFPVDGAVVKLDSLALQREAGAGETSPRWALAYKFEPERAETELLAITLQVGRTGVLTPVAELAPVRLAGVVVTRATLHNRDEIARRDIRVGDTVYVERAGEVIPAVTGVNFARRSPGTPPFAFPLNCPECRGKLEHRTTEAAVRCDNTACPGQLRRRLEHFASKACVDIEGLGPVMIEKLVSAGRVADLPDLYHLRREDLLTLERTNAASADRLLAAIERSKRTELWRVIHGLGIPQVGPATARELARRFGSLEALAASPLVERDTHGVRHTSRNPALANAAETDSALRTAAHFLGDERNRARVAALLAAGLRPTTPTPATSPAPAAGKSFVLTGTLPTLTRAQATARIVTAGGKVGSTVSRTTDFVVAGSDPGAKLVQANSLGVPILDEAALLRMLPPE